MIVMVILSLFLFTLTDLFMDPSANLWLLGILIGGAVFGIAGIGQGRWLQWGIGGALLGAALGFILPGFVGGGGLNSSLGVIDEEEVYDLETRRYVANQFIVAATEASFGEGTGRFATLFGFGHNSNREDVIFGKLMRAEADRLGITVDKKMVVDYLNRVTSDKLTEDDYIETRNKLVYKNKQLDDDVLTSVLGDEIKARMAYQMLRPRTTSLPPGPEVYWQYFRRMNVRQQLHLAALDLDEFTDAVGEPSDSEVNDLFAEFSRKFPNQVEPGSPGFRLPFRAKIAYLEIDSKTVEGEIGEVTDEDVQKYYDENKETPMIRQPVMPDFDEGETPAEPKADGDSEKSDDTEPAEPKATEPAEPKEAAPADPKATEPQKDSNEEDSKPKETAEPESTSPEAESDKPADETPEAPKAETKESDSAEEGDSSGDECGPFDEEPSDEATEDEATAESTEGEPATEDNSDDAATNTDEGSNEDSAPDKAEEEADPETSTKGDDATQDKTDAASVPSLEIPLKPKKDGADETPAEPKPAEATPKAPPEPKYEYRALDDELKSEIREEIKRQRIKEAIDSRMDKAKLEMETLANRRNSERFARIEEDPSKYEGRGEEQQEALEALRQEMQPVHDQVNADLKKYAEANGLAYVETPMVGYADLLEEEDYPIGTASEPNDNPMMAAQSATVAFTLFDSFSNDEQNNDAQIYLARRAVRRSASLDAADYHYAYWVIDFSKTHIPELEEVRDDVVLAWKRMKARELATERGEELAKLVRDGLAKEGEEKLDMATALKDATVTGSKDGSALAVQKTLPFSWMRTSSASPMSFQRPQASLSPVMLESGGSLDRIGDDFMESVFNEMNDEEVSVVPNGDLSKYYVVHVTNRFPTPEIGEDGLRDRFSNEGKQFAFAQSPIVGVMQRDLDSPASLAWEKSVWLRYDIDPDAEPEDE